VPTEEDVSLGTPRFFSPEQASGLPLDPRTDVYSMGLVLYALVAGRGPFDHLRTVSSVLSAHINLVPPPPSELAGVRISPDLEAVILTAVAKNPDDRYPSAATFGQALRTVARRGRRSTIGRASPSPTPTPATARASLAARSAGALAMVGWMMLATTVVVLLRVALR
jgi:serine/threonine-protein kinase